MKQLITAALVTTALIAPAAHADFSGNDVIGNFQALGPGSAPAVVPLPPAIWLLGASISGW
ncbi:MAG: hypothetical protein ACU85U_06770 [Gammaproteobacteria bacterium]